MGCRWGWCVVDGGGCDGGWNGDGFATGAGRSAGCCDGFCSSIAGDVDFIGGSGFCDGSADFGFGSADCDSSLTTLPSSCLDACSPATKPSRNSAPGAR